MPASTSLLIKIVSNATLVCFLQHKMLLWYMYVGRTDSSTGGSVWIFWGEGVGNEREGESTFRVSISSFVGQNLIRFSIWSMSRTVESIARIAFWKHAWPWVFRAKTLSKTSANESSGNTILVSHFSSSLQKFTNTYLQNFREIT